MYLLLTSLLFLIIGIMLFQLFFVTVLVPSVVTGRPNDFSDDFVLTIGSQETVKNEVIVEFDKNEERFSEPISKCSGEGDLIYEPDKKCYKRGTRTQNEDSPCSDKFLHFEERMSKPGYGDCFYCELNRKLTRPVVFWEPTRRCYWLWDQGPCKPGQWLVPTHTTSEDDDGETRKSLGCRKRTCPENGKEEESQFSFWFEVQGKCYRSDVLSSGTRKQEPALIVNPEGSHFLMGTWGINSGPKKGEEGFVQLRGNSYQVV